MGFCTDAVQRVAVYTTNMSSFEIGFCFSQLILKIWRLIIKNKYTVYYLYNVERLIWAVYPISLADPLKLW